MNINIDCFKDVLIYTADNIRYQYIDNSITTINVDLNTLYEADCLKQYGNIDIMYSVLKLEECNFIKVATKYPSNKPYLERCIIEDVTFIGHQFLENVREPTIWEKAKSIANKVGNHTINFLETTAHDIAIEAAKQATTIVMMQQLNK